MLECIDNINNWEKINWLEIWNKYKMKRRYRKLVWWKEVEFVEVYVNNELKELEFSRFKEI